MVANDYTANPDLNPELEDNFLVTMDPLITGKITDLIGSLRIVLIDVQV